MIKNFKWLLLVSLTFVACSSNDDAVVDPNSTDGLPLTAGSADFSKYVSLGNSLCAGYSDGALFMPLDKQIPILTSCHNSLRWLVAVNLKFHT